jgi:hypothetical protein
MRCQSQGFQYCTTPSGPLFGTQRLESLTEKLQPHTQKLQPQIQRPQYRIQKAQNHSTSTVLRSQSLCSQLLQKRFDEKAARSEKQQSRTEGSLQQPPTEGLQQQPPKGGYLKREADLRSRQDQWHNDPAFIMEARKTELAAIRIMMNLGEWQRGKTKFQRLRDMIPDISY